MTHKQAVPYFLHALANDFISVTIWELSMLQVLSSRHVNQGFGLTPGLGFFIQPTGKPGRIAILGSVSRVPTKLVFPIFFFSSSVLRELFSASYCKQMLGV